MEYQSVFKRYELKFLLTNTQKELLLKTMEPYMLPDRFGQTTIRNIYFDTDNYRLIRQSIEKPVYKEKLRIRSYARAQEDSPVFVELKKKYKSVVYKRRTVMTEQQAIGWLCENQSPPEQSQITDEIAYFCEFYGTLHPAVFLSYDRQAYYSSAGEDFRVTFDKNILFREEDISLTSEVWGTPLLKEGMVLMELKTPGSIPLWMTQFLTEQKLYKTSFSKYGSAYCNYIWKANKGAYGYV